MHQINYLPSAETLTNLICGEPYLPYLTNESPAHWIWVWTSISA